MRSVIAIFFLLLFSLQVIPIKTIGKLLSKSQQTEEVKDGCCDADDDDASDNNKEDKYNQAYPHYEFTATLATSKSKKKATIYHNSDDLPNSHITDIHCPPPNC